MSTKIYNGWIVNNITLEKLLPRLKRFQKAVEDKAAEIGLGFAIKRLVRYIDTAAMHTRRISWDNPGNHIWAYNNASLFSLVMHEIDDEIRGSFESSRKEFMDLGCQLTCHPVNGDVLIIMFDQTGEDYESLFKKIVKAKPFPYWNNTDRPDNMTVAQWNARGKLWDKALGDDGIPAHGGFSYDCLTEENRPLLFLPNYRDEAQWAKHVPSFEYRTKNAAEQTIFERRVQGIVKKDPKATFGASYQEVLEWTRSKPGKTAIATALVQAKKRLKKNFTLKDFEIPAKKVLRLVAKKKK